MSTSKKPSEGFILLPVVFMLLTATLILFALSQQLYTHILLTKEVHQYLNAETAMTEIIPTIETQLSQTTPDTPNPRDQTELLNNSDTWPSYENKYHIYSQLIHLNNNNAIYSSLIIISDHNAEQRIIYELISACTLADHQCNPLQLTQL